MPGEYDVSVRLVSFGWVAAGGVIAVGMNSAGTILAVGLNAVAPIAIGGINAAGIVAVGGVNAIGAWGIGGVNAMGDPLIAAGAAGVYFLVTLVVAVLKREAIEREPEPETVPLAQLPDEGACWTRAARVTQEGEVLTLHAGAIRRDAALAAPVDDLPRGACLVHLRVLRRATEGADYRTAATEAVLEVIDVRPARTLREGAAAFGASLRTRWTAHVVVAVAMIAGLLGGRAAGWFP